ncbi:MAG: hypothetical protein JNK53_00865 [Phycisphaerae bacterium]|nr:hypothetical protein [Phycisphaerae bacterium]
MSSTSMNLLHECTGEQLLMLAIANAGLRPSVGRVLDSRAKASRRRPSAVAGRVSAGQTALVLRRVG